MAQPIPIARRMLYSAVVFAGFLVILEGALALLPRLLVDNDAAELATGSAGAVVCVGDSVTAGVGIPQGQAWPDHLELLLARHDIALLRAATATVLRCCGRVKLGGQQQEESQSLELSHKVPS